MSNETRVVFYRRDCYYFASPTMEVPKIRPPFMAKGQDPTSHRIIEKRRRDRMNNCLADLSRLIPPDYLKKGRGRIEKTEIIEMATRYIKFLQNKRTSHEQDASPAEGFRRGYQECLSEALRYLVEKQGYYSSDAMCVQFISHLQHHCAKINKGTILNVGHTRSADRGGYSTKLQSNVEINPPIKSSNHNGVHNQQFVASHNGQHMGQADSEGNNKDMSRRKHSNSYAACNDDKSYNYSGEADQNQSSAINGGKLSPEETTMGRRTSFSQQNTKLANDDYGPMDISNNMEDEEGATRINIMRNMMYVDKDEYTTPSQDTRSENLYSPVSYIQNNNENSLRNVRKQDLAPGENGNFSVDMDNHSYKFKNTIKQRFSQSQSTDYRSSSPSDGLTNIGSTSSNDPSPPRNNQNHGSAKFNHKRRKVTEHHNRHNVSDNYDQSSSGTNSSETNGKHAVSMYKHKLLDSKDSLLEDSVKSDVLSIGKLNGKMNGNKKYDDKFSCMANPGGVPIFALHAKGSFYIPMNVDYDCLMPFLGHYDLLDVATLQPNISLHPVTINVNFQPTYVNNKVAIQNIRTRTDKKSW